MKQKQQKSILKAGTAVLLVARAVPTDLEGDIFLSHISYFHPESAPNPLSFAPRLNLSDIYS